MGADAYLIVVDAIKRAGSSDSKKIRDALASTKDFEGSRQRLRSNRMETLSRPW